MNDEDLFGVNDLDGDEVIVDVTANENVKQNATVAEKELSAATDEVVTTAESVEGISAATTPQISKDDMKAKMKEEERIAREKNKANIAVIEEWDDVQATIDADRQKYFAAKRAEEIKNKPPTKAQQKSLMCNYMKNMEGYKQKDLKGKIFDAIKKMFNKVYKKVNNFVTIDPEVMEGSKKTQAKVTKGSSKRAGGKIEQESAKRQRLEKDDDTAKLKEMLGDSS
nr:hypothetical protein [Tanacetum cinerariifolium]